MEFKEIKVFIAMLLIINIIGFCMLYHCILYRSNSDSQWMGYQLADIKYTLQRLEKE